MQKHKIYILVTRRLKTIDFGQSDIPSCTVANPIGHSGQDLVKNEAKRARFWKREVREG